MRRGKLEHYNGSFYAGVNGISGDLAGLGAILKHCKVMLERMPIGCLVYDKDFQLTYSNPAATTILGYSSEELLGTRPEFIVPAGEMEKVDFVLDRLMQSESDTMSMNRNRRKDGRIITCSWVNTPLFGNRGEYLGMLSMVRDISGQVKLVEDLRQMVERYESLVNSIGEGMVITDKDGRYVYANPAMEQIYGGPVEQILGRRLADFAVQSADDPIAADRSGREAGSYRSLIRAADGKLRTVEVSGSPRYNDQGEFEGLVALIQDVSSRVEAERALQEREAEYRQLFESSPLPMLLCDARSATVMLANEAAIQLYGYDRDEFQGLDLSILRPAAVRADFHKLWQDRVRLPAWSGSFEQCRKSGEQLTVDIHSCLVQFSEQPVRLLVLQDVSEKRRAEDRMRASARLAQAVIRHSPLAVAVRNREGQLVMFNETWRRLYRLSDEEVQAASRCSFSEFRSAMEPYYSPEELLRMTEVFSSGGEHVLAEACVSNNRSPDEYRWVSRHSYAIRDEQGEVQFVVTLTRDITEVKRAADQLDSIEQLNRAVVDNSPLGICVRSKDGRLLGYNPAWQQIRGLSDADITLQMHRSVEQRRIDVLSYYGPENGARVLDIYEQGGSLYLENLQLHDSPPGAAKYISQHLYSLPGPDGAVDRVVILTQDVSAAHAAAERISQNEERFRLAAAVTSDALYEWDALSQKTWRSDSYFRLFGLEHPADNLTTDWFTDLLHPVDRETTLQRLAAALERGDTEWSAEYRLRAGNGEYREISDRGLIIYAENGEPLKLIGAISDVTEQRLAARQREAAEKLSALVIENATVGITVRSAEGRLLLYNERWREIWGVEDQEIELNYNFDLQQTHAMLVSTFGPEQAAAVMDLFSRAGTHRIDDVRWQRGGNPDDVRWISTLFCSVEDSSGAVSRVVALTVDNTEAALAEHRLRDSEARYRTLLELVPDAIVVTRDGRFVFANAAAAELVGCGDPSRLLNEDFWQFVQSDQRQELEQRLQQAAAGERLQPLQSEAIRLDGSSVSVESVTALVSFDSQPAHLTVLRDVSDRRRAEASLRQRDDMLEAIAYAAPQFTDGGLNDEQVLDLLARLGQAARVSCVYLLERQFSDPAGLQLQNRLQWNVSPELTPRSELPYRELGFDELEQLFGRGQPAFGSISDFPPATAAVLESYGMRSFLIVPLFIGQEWWGFIGVEDRERERNWSTAELDVMKLAANLLGAAMARTRAQELLRQSEERYRSLVNVAPDGVYVASGGSFRFVNPTLVAMLGLNSVDELVGRRVADFVHPDYLALSRERRIELESQGGSLPVMEEVFLRADGSPITVEVASTSIRYENEPAAIVVLRDISERKQVQKSLRMRDAILEAIAKVAPKLLAGPLSRDLSNELLEGIGLAANVSRVAVFECHPDAAGFRVLSCRSEWVAHNVRRLSDNPMAQEMEHNSSSLAAWVRELRAGRTIQGSMSSLSSEFRHLLAFLEVRSLVLTPIFVGEEWWGSIGFDDCSQEREWSDAEVDALKLAASLLGAAVQRERAQLDLRASEERLRLVNAATSDALYDWDIQGNYVWRSDTYYDFFGLVTPTPEASEGWWDEHLHPDDRASATSSLLRAVADGEERWSCEYRFRRGDGGYAEVADRGIIVRDGSGRAVRMIGAISDITARRQGERRLKESEERYRLLAENSSDMISKNTTEGIFTYVSDSCYDLLGYRKEELLGTSTYDYFHPDDLEQVARSHSAVLRGQSVQSITYRFRRKDGSYVWFETLTRPDQDETGSLGVEIIATSRDVTERRQAELALRESEQRYRTLYNNTPVMLHSIDREGRIISVSDYWLSVMGYNRGEVLGRSALDFVAEQSLPDARAMMAAFMQDGYCQDFELQFVKRSNECIDVLTSAIAERNEDGTLQRGLAVMADITERKRAQRQLQATVVQLKNIYDFSQVCGHSGSQEELLKAALDALRNTIHPLKAGLLLPRSDNLLRFAVWQGLSHEFRHCIENHAPWPAGLQESLLIRNVETDNQVVACRDVMLRDGVQALAYLPVRHLNRIVGWCLLGFEHSHAFTREERQLAETILSQLGSAIERRRSELELRENERGLARAQELAHLGSWQWGIETGQTVWSDELFRIVGLEPGSIAPRGLSILEYVHPEDQEQVHAALQGVLDNGEAASLDFRILRPGGEEVYVHAECIPELSPQNQTLRIGGTVQDITERVRAENELLLARDQADQSRRRASAILDAAPEAIIMIDEQGVVDTYSEGAERIFGYSAEEIIGQKLNVLMGPDDQLRHEEAILRAAENGRSRMVNQSREVTGRHQDGRLIELELTIRDTFLGGRRMYVGVMRDISERKRMQLQLRQSQKMEAIGTLAGGIAHDFNNILQSILGYTDLAHDCVGRGHQAQEYLNVVVKAGLRARELVRQILAFSRKSDLQLSVVDLSLIAGESARLMRAAMPATISIRTELPDQDIHVLGDPVQLHQVLMNLCTNAGYAMRDRGGNLTISLRRRYCDAELARYYPELRPGLYAELSVADSGAGMSREVLERIFEPFYTTKPVGEGTGMGLSVVHGIIHTLGGTIHVDSEPGRGTTFRVYLPIAEAAVAVEESRDTETPVGNERILLVDDEEAIAEMVSLMLGRLGYKITHFTDPRQALREFTENPRGYDLLITDQTMPGMTGAVLAGRVLELRRDLPIIVCTGYSDMFTPEQAQEMGVQAYLYKPVGLADLAQTIRQVLSRSRSAVDIHRYD